MNFREVRNALYSVLALSSIAMVAGSGAHAASITCAENSNVQLTGIALSSATTPNPNPNLLAGTPSRVYNSYGCTGFAGNDSGLADSSPNIGLRNMGLLNFDSTQGSDYSYNLLIEESDLQAIGDPNVAEDPG